MVAAANATPGIYQVIIGATNNDFTANTPRSGRRPGHK